MRHLLAGLCAMLALSAVSAADESPPAKKGLDRATLEKDFAERLSGCVLVGQYSVVTDGGTKAGAEERYTITKVSKVKDDYWLFQTRIEYGDKDVTIPITLPVLWAGDTPVITLSDLTIPGLGTFTARVMIHKNRYAGTWQHDQVGGHMWGRVERLQKTP